MPLSTEWILIGKHAFHPQIGVTVSARYARGGVLRCMHAALRARGRATHAALRAISHVLAISSSSSTARYILTFCYMYYYWYY